MAMPRAGNRFERKQEKLIYCFMRRGQLRLGQDRKWDRGFLQCNFSDAVLESKLNK